MSPLWMIIGVAALIALVVVLLVRGQQLRRKHRTLDFQLRFEQLVTEISAALVSLHPEDIDAEIIRSLEKVRASMALDHCVLFDRQYGSSIRRITHHAAAPNVPPLDAVCDMAPLSWFMRQIDQGRFVALTDPARDLPPDATPERQYCLDRQLRSLLIIPVRHNTTSAQWMGCFSTSRELKWPEILVTRLHVIGEILASALAGMHAELALRQSEQFNREILSSLKEQVAVLDRQGVIRMVNQSWIRFAEENGAGTNTAVGVDYLEVCRRAMTGPSGPDVQRVVAGIDAVLRGLIPSYETEYPCHSPTTQRWFRMTVTPLATAEGGAVVMHWDVTERWRMTDALRISEERYREVVESQTDLVCRYLSDTTLTLVNEAYCRFFRLPREKLIGRKFIEFIPESGRAAVMERVAEIVRDRQVHVYEHEVSLPDGSTGWQQWVDYVIVDADGSIEEIQGIGRDISDRKRAEEARHNLAHASRLAIVGELTASIAHEINQPLGAILSNTDAAEMLLDRSSPPLDEIRNILSDIRKDDMRAGDIIAHLRALLRKRELEFHPLNLNEIVHEVVRLASSDLQRRRIKLALQLAPGLPEVRGDRVHLQQVLLNLVVNAMDAMNDVPPSTRLQLTVSSAVTPQGLVEIVVSDSGPGIPPERLSRIFDSFFTTKKEGMGLGLSIARSLIEVHHGTIAAANNPGGGASFRFQLPVRSP